MIRAITYNCQGLKSSIHDIQSLCSTYDLIFIQESWLFQFELPLLSKIDPDFEGYGTSAIVIIFFIIIIIIVIISSCITIIVILLFLLLLSLCYIIYDRYNLLIH